MSVPFYPKNRAATEHRGQLFKVIKGVPEQPFVMLKLADGAVVMGEAHPDLFVTGTTYRFLGRWHDDPTYGPRFKFSTHVVHAVHNKVGVVKYLTALCDGFGEKKAARVYEKYRGDAVLTLRTNPELVAAECGLGLDECREAARQLEDASRFEDTRLELFALFDGRGFQGRLIDRAINRWDVRAPALIRRNPFRLLGMPSAGFKRCDRLWCDLAQTDRRLKLDSPKRLAILAQNLLNTDRHGNTWVSAHELGERLVELEPRCDPFRAFKLALRARLLKKHATPDGTRWLATYRRATSEERVAANLKRLSAAPRLWPTDSVPVSREEGDRLPSAHQVEQLRAATAEPVGLFLGGPGTGKTHTLAYLLKEVIAGYGRGAVLVCAPTGKAAVRATQALKLAKLNLEAATIHSTLEIGRNGHDGDGWAFVHDRSNPLACKFLVCDETSMNDTDLMADLLDACPTGCQVLFVGDPHQLPPVGHGAPLRDLIEGRVPHGELTEVRRNAGLIVRACQQIKAGQRFDVAPAIDLGASEPRNLVLLEPRNEAHARELLCETLNGLRAAAGFDPTWQTQVIVARNTKGEVSRKRLNEMLRPMLNPGAKALKGNPFAIGDKIICTRNGWLHAVRLPRDAEDATAAKNYFPVQNPDGGQAEVYVANGEIGRVVAVGPKQTVARFSEGDALVKILMGKPREEGDEDGIAGEDDAGGATGCNFDHAYAITTHKCQGSEAPCVIVMGDEQAASLTTREWIYTAVSRASKLCILIGKRGTFDRMVGRRVLNRRKTFLKRLILDDRYSEL